MSPDFIKDDLEIIAYSGEHYQSIVSLLESIDPWKSDPMGEEYYRSMIWRAGGVMRRGIMAVELMRILRTDVNGLLPKSLECHYVEV